MDNSHTKKIDSKTLTMQGQNIVQVSPQNNPDISSSTISDLVSKINQMETEIQALKKDQIKSQERFEGMLDIKLAKISKTFRIDQKRKY